MQRSSSGAIRLTVEELIQFLETCSDEDREQLMERIHDELERRKKLKDMMNDIIPN